MKLFDDTVTERLTTGLTITRESAKKPTRKVRADPTMLFWT